MEFTERILLKIKFFIILLLSVENFANKLQQCHTNPCQNGGECYRAGDSIDPSTCDHGWTLYNRMCYNLVKSEQAWADAFRHCRSFQANLLSIESVEERRFVKEFMRTELKKSDKYPFNLWTTGKLMSNDPEPVWGWVRNESNETKIEPNEQFWRKDNSNPTNAPDIKTFSSNIWLSGRYFESSDNNTFFWLRGYEKLPILIYFWNDSDSSSNNDACISVSSSSEYNEWIVDNCQDKRNYFVCEKDEPTVVESNGHYFYQCRCKPGFHGFNCEMSPEKYADAQQQICDTESFQFSCSPKDSVDSKQNIVVEYALYGHLANVTTKKCGEKKIDQPDCVADNSLLSIANKCQGHPSCSIGTPKMHFEINPCLPGTSGLTLEYRFRCVEEEKSCPTEFIQHKESCFEIIYKEERSERKSWMDARKYCMSKGGDVLRFADGETHNILVGELSKRDEKKVKYFWIGLKMERSEQQDQIPKGKWINGSEFTFSPTGSRFDDNDGDCVAYYVQPPSRIVWLSKNCNYFYNWICQYSLRGPERPKLQDPSWVHETEAMQTTLAPTYLTLVQKTTATSTPSSPVTTTVDDDSNEEHKMTIIEENTDETHMSIITEETHTAVTTESPSTPSTIITTLPSTTRKRVSRPKTSTTTESVPTTRRRTRLTTEPSIVTRRSTRTTEPSVLTRRSTRTTSRKVRPTPVTRYPIIEPTTTTDMIETSHRMKIMTEPSTSSEDYNVPNVFFNGSINNSTERWLQQTTSFSFGNSTVNNSNVTEMTTTEETRMVYPRGTCYRKNKRNIEWPETPEGETAIVRCPNTSSSQSHGYLYCKKTESGVKFVDDPDLSQCKHDDVMDAIRDKILKNRSATEIVSDVYNFWFTNQTYTNGGDINASLLMISDIIVLQRKQLQQASISNVEKQRIVSQFTNQTGMTINIMLSNNVAPIWKDFPINPSYYATVTLLMHNVEDNSDLLGEFLDMNLEKTNKTVSFDNSMYVKVDVYRMPQIAQPGTRTGNILPTSILDGFGHSDGFIDGESTMVSLKSSTKVSMNSAKNQISIPLSGTLRVNTTTNSFSPVSANDGLDVNSGSNDLRVGMVEYPDSLSTLLNSTNLYPSENFSGKRMMINSQIVGATINRKKEMIILSENQTTTLWHLKLNCTKPKCVYWNTTKNMWDSWGCTVVESNDDHTVCACNHLTSFAVLMDVTGAYERTSKLHQQLLHYVTIVGCIISIVCLTICIIVFSCFRTLWNQRNTIHRNLCLCLLVAELLFVCGVDRVEHKEACKTVAILLQYFFLASFSWMLMEGYQLYRMLIKVFEGEKSYMIVYYLISYGLPAIITAISVGIRFDDYGTDKYCWINVQKSTIWAFAAPVALVVMLNIIFLAMALKAVLCVSSMHERTKFQRLKGWLKGSTMLLSLLGITWIFGFLCAIDSNQAAVAFAYIFAVLNSLQGVFIFAFHVVLNEKCHSAIMRTCRRNFPEWVIRKADSIASNSTGSTNLKKLSDSVRNTNSVRPRSPDGNFLNGNTFYLNQAKFRLHDNNFDNNLNEDNFVSTDKNFAPVIQDPMPKQISLEESNNISGNVLQQAVRQRYSKNPRIIRKETNEEENENFLKNRNFFIETKNDDGPHVLTIPTGDIINNHQQILNNINNQMKDDFVGHF